ncbi:hypothetical protein JQ561_27420 [Bradyrhizobium diazoefficiens]|uniref:hypothetical protein n=1 Tax=Bradyrhizobium sp. WYCCWR 12699 TaxID=3064203 RepID=UPI001BA87DD6|nr:MULTISPECIES: hypothetical protein [Bradyrhizobium]MBR0930354.1 hypothetical protein [Bradyrhizobium diazoefficiens]MDT4741628.1 hypothetical protein [Bradyrhizobium sp. WYCCWR 12699]
MPIFRYFVFVGGALLALLFAANFALPSQPVAQAVATVSNDQPLIRIRSDRHLPERVVLDTTQPTIVPPAMKTAAVVAPQPADTASAAALAEMSAKARVRETFAQFTPEPKADAAAGKKDAKPQVQAQAQPPKRKTARAHSVLQQQDRPMMVAQRPQFGFFGNTW